MPVKLGFCPEPPPKPFLVSYPGNSVKIHFIVRGWLTYGIATGPITFGGEINTKVPLRRFNGQGTLFIPITALNYAFFV